MRKKNLSLLISAAFLVSASAYAQTSLWSDSVTTTGITSWGTKAMGGSRTAPSNAVPIYVIDTGVANHENLVNVRRASPNYPQASSFSPAMPMVGCYTHATGVAGVIGASSSSTMVNASMSRGLYEKAPITSVAVGNDYNTANWCIKDELKVGQNGILNDTDTFKNALAYVKEEIKKSGRMGIINISNNKEEVFKSEDFRRYMREEIAKPSADGTYKGAFIVQSAGNQNSPVCNYAYGPADSADGIMVVGAFDEKGQRAVGMNDRDSEGSNFGNCVEAWAPGKRIYMPWMGFNTTVNGQTTYKTYDYVDGTSFSAPYIAAAASYIATEKGINSPQELENAIRSSDYWYKVGTYLDTSTQQQRDMWSIDLSRTATTPPPTPSGPPTATWYVNGSNVNNQSVKKLTGEPFTLEFKSTNATSCTTKATGGNQTLFNESQLQRNWGTQKLTKNQSITNTYQATCQNAQGQTVTSTFYLYEQAPLVNWFVNSWQTYPDETVSMTKGQTYSLRFYSENVNFCYLTAYNNGAFWYSADSSSGLGTGYTWPGVNTWAGVPGAKTTWSMRCQNQYGYAATKNVSIATR